MKHLSGCFLSALLASLVTAWWASGPTESPATAQIAPAARSQDRSGGRDRPANGEIVRCGRHDAGRGDQRRRLRGCQPGRGEYHLQGEGGTLPDDGAAIRRERLRRRAEHRGPHSDELSRRAGCDGSQVTLYNGESYEAELVGADPLNDLAVIRIDAHKTELFPVTIGDSRDLKVGMRVFALGNPFGLERTLTTGIISSLNRSLQIRGNWTIKSIIQIDACHQSRQLRRSAARIRTAG